MEMAVVQLGGHPVYIQKEEVGLGTPRERRGRRPHPRLLSCDHRRPGDGPSRPRAMAAATDKPLLNMLSDQRPSAPGAGRPADREAVARPARGRAHRLCRRRRQQCLPARSPQACVAARRRADARQPAKAMGSSDAPEASARSPTRPRRWRAREIVYTDVWVSMGQDEEARGAARRRFAPYQVDEALMARCRRRPLPPLPPRPARRGGERTR